MTPTSWLTVAVVLCIIGIALMCLAWRERDKDDDEPPYSGIGA